MTIRNVKDIEAAIGGVKLFDLMKRTNLYPSAFPFDRAKLGKTSPVAFLTFDGSNPTVITLVDIWPLNITRTLPTVGFTIGISSGSASDTSAGTGARTVEVDCLDVNYVPYTKTFTLSGQTKVVDTGTLVGNVLRINDVRVKTVGSGLKNAGIVYVYDSSDTVTAGVPQTSTKIFGCVAVGDNISHSAFYTVPAGCQLQTAQFRGGFRDLVAANRSGTISLNLFPTGTAPGFSLPIGSQISDAHPWSMIDPGYLTVFDEKTDIVLRSATNNISSAVVAYLDCVLFYKFQGA